jgi:hypothetical protein
VLGVVDELELAPALRLADRGPLRVDEAGRPHDLFDH